MDAFFSDKNRSEMLSRLRNRKNFNWEKEWSETIPEGNVFPDLEDLPSYFETQLKALGGEVIWAENEKNLFEILFRLMNERNWGKVFVAQPELRNRLVNSGIKVILPEAWDECDAGITHCEVMIALTGSVMVSSMGGSGRRMNVFPPAHIVLARKSQFVGTIEEGFRKIEGKYSNPPSQISLISGPSRTADIEKTLVMGAHGPKELIVLIDLNS